MKTIDKIMAQDVATNTDCLKAVNEAVTEIIKIMEKLKLPYPLIVQAMQLKVLICKELVEGNGNDPENQSGNATPSRCC